MWDGRKRGNKLLRCFMIEISDISSGNIIELTPPNNLSKAIMPPHIRGVLNPFLSHPTALALTHLRCGLKYPLAYARIQQAGSTEPAKR